MTTAYYCDDNVVVVTSKEEKNVPFDIERLFSDSDFMILTKTFFALGAEKRGIGKIFSLYEQDNTHTNNNFFNNFQIGLYKVPSAITQEEENSPLFSNIINIVIRQHERLCRTSKESFSIFADKDLFDAYFHSIKKLEIKFKKILHISTEEEY